MNTPDLIAGEASPAAALHRLAVSFWLSQSLYVMAKLRVADQLSGGPRPVHEVATAVGAEAKALCRVMRALASIGVFTETAPKQFALTAMRSYLQSGVAGSLRAQFLTINELDWLPWGHLLHSVRTGETAFEHHHGMGLFDYLERHPDVGKMFDEAMTGFVTENGLAVASAYDFSQFATVIDVGGGHGALVTAILQAAALSRLLSNKRRGQPLLVGRSAAIPASEPRRRGCRQDLPRRQSPGQAYIAKDSESPQS